MKTRLVLATPVLAALIGCAGQKTPFEVGADHPANPMAVSASWAVRSNTLDLSSADPVLPAERQFFSSQNDKTNGSEHGTHGRQAGEQPTLPDHQHGQEAMPPQSAGDDPPTSRPAVGYACPMHPEVTSAESGQKCHICGMALEMVEDGGSQR